MAANAYFSVFCRATSNFSRLFVTKNRYCVKIHRHYVSGTNSSHCPKSLTEILNLPENQPPKGGDHVPHQQLERQEQKPQPTNVGFGHINDVVPSSTPDGGVDDGITLEPAQPIRTETDDPTQHTVLDLSKFYTVDPDFMHALTAKKIVRLEFMKRSQALHDCALMVREPALECLEMAKSAVGKDMLAAKAVLYGKDGCGKSSTFVHVLNACYNKNWFIMCPIRPNVWRFHYKQVALSTRKNGRIDLPQEAAEFLSFIKEANKRVFQQFGDSMRTHDTYVWSKREETPQNTTIEELIDYGIERPKYSPDVVGVLLKEIRLYSHEWPTSTVLAIDGVNGFFGETNLIVDRETKQTLAPTDISMIHNLVKLANSDWRNGFMLFTVDATYMHKDHRSSHLPRYLLTEAGFNALNPFVPIEVRDYSDEEINVALDYFTERQWMQNKVYRTSRQARKELIFLSANNPLYLDNVLRSL